MKNSISIAKDLNLPRDAVTQTFAQIGRKGAGKTYLSSMLAEQMLDVHARIIVLDPIGNWWGLRVNADGKSKGKDIFVMGGSHGDIPLSSEIGKEIAKLLAEKKISVILDISEFRKNERKKFVTDFAEEFYHLKKSSPSPVHVFLEEAQKFVPQQPQRDEARMLGAWEDIVRLGRNYGIGSSLISQRPQSINKEVLSQVECLCVLQVTGLHERNALEKWVQEAGEDRKIVGELPGLKTGEGYVWSPQWLRLFKKVKFNKKTTLDTSATPELGKATKVAKISKIDVKELQAHMNKVMENRKIELKTINELKAEVNRLNMESRKMGVESKKLVVTGDPNLKRELYQLKADYERNIKLAEKLKSNISYLEKEITEKTNLLQQIKSLVSGKAAHHTPLKMPTLPAAEVKRAEREAAKPHLEIRPTPIIEHSETNEFTMPIINSKKSSGAMRMLKAAAMYYPKPISKARMAAIAGLSHKSGTFTTYIASLKKGVFIEISGEDFVATEEGFKAAGDVQPIPTDPDSIISMWCGILKGGPSRMLKATYEAYPNSITKEELGEKSGITHTSGTFTTYMAILKRNGLVEATKSEVKTSEKLFE